MEAGVILNLMRTGAGPPIALPVPSRTVPATALRSLSLSSWWPTRAGTVIWLEARRCCRSSPTHCQCAPEARTSVGLPSPNSRFRNRMPCTVPGATGVSGFSPGPEGHKPGQRYRQSRALSRLQARTNCETKRGAILMLRGHTVIHCY